MVRKSTELSEKEFIMTRMEVDVELQREIESILTRDSGNDSCVSFNRQ